jgi:hypothetical protein
MAEQWPSVRNRDRHRTIIFLATGLSANLRFLDRSSGPVFGGVREMVNCNQTRGAAGTAAWFAVRDRLDAAEIQAERPVWDE